MYCRFCRGVAYFTFNCPGQQKESFMKSITQKVLWVLLAIAIFVGLIWQFYPLPDAEKRLHALPLQGPGFIGQDAPLNEFELKFFNKVNVVKRLYRVDHENYFVTVLDGTKD